MAEKHYDFFQNRLCEYYPCHPGADPETFSCLFCYCPSMLWAIAAAATFTTPPNGIKDCTHCLRPHIRENYSKILEKMPEILELAKKDGERPDWECLHVPGDLCWDRLQRRPNWPLPAGANSYTFADGEGGRDMPKVFGSKARVCDRPIFFLWSNMVRGSSLYCLLFCI